MKHKEQMILDILQDQEMQGFEIANKLGEEPENIFAQKIGTLYPILHSLKKQRFLKSYVINKDGKERIYYKRTHRRGGDHHES